MYTLSKCRIVRIGSGPATSLTSMYEIEICRTYATVRRRLGAGQGSAGGARRWGSSCGPSEVALSLGEIERSRKEECFSSGTSVVQNQNQNSAERKGRIIFII
jgi:hypothetical protein